MRTTLDPKLDVVFKLLFADEQNRELLVSLLTAVLEPRQPIVDVVVLNPDTPKDTVVDKGAVLDVRAQLLDGRLANVEMQTAPHRGLRQRALFYWARLYTGQLGRGQDYVELAQTTSVFILGFSELETTRYHSVFRLLEQHEHSRLTDDLAIHVLELPNLPKRAPVATDPSVLNWGRFFAAQTDEELAQVATMDPKINEAKTALERLSADPAARELAREREVAAWNYERTLRLAREEGERKGQRETVRKLLTQLFDDLSPQQEQRIDEATPAELDEFVKRVRSADTIDDVLAPVASS
jgi:predicted transposase/invertase (TIGR01784 family)